MCLVIAFLKISGKLTQKTANSCEKHRGWALGGGLHGQLDVLSHNKKFTMSARLSSADFCFQS